MKAYKYIAIAALASAALAGCSDDSNELYGEGRVVINTSINTDMKIMSRADNDALTKEFGESLMLWISNSKGVIRQYNGIDEVPATVPLQTGSYLAEAWAGDSVSASWNKRWFKAAVPFTVEKDVTTPVNVVCKIANVAVEVNYKPEVDDVLTDYSLTVAHSRGKLVFENEYNDSTAYFMMPKADNNLSYTLTGTKNDGTVYTRTGYLCKEGDAVKPGYKYIINVSCSQGAEDEIGGGFLKIVIDETENVTNDTVELYAAPQIAGVGFDIDQPLRSVPGALGRKSVYVTAATGIKNVVFKMDGFGTIAGISGDDVDLKTISGDIAAKVEAAGVTTTYIEQTDGTSNMKINLEAALLNKLTTEGEYSVTITVKDDNNKTTTKTLNIVISEAPLAIGKPNVQMYGATLNGEILKSDGLDMSSVKFIYREKGTSAWSELTPTVSGTSLSVATPRIKQNTKYECALKSSTFTTGTIEFTTEADWQLPNGGFEDWQTSSTPYLIYPNGGDMFWDSGNHGSATMKKNVTVPDGSIKHSGNYSIKLASQFVGVGAIGKFAAGNVFIGEYLKTDGTDGVLGWGRRFMGEGKPVAIHGWVKYSPASVTHTNAGAPDIVKGQLDKGIIYVALLDGRCPDSSYPDFPVIIKTKSSQLFDKNGSNVIAYGEKVFESATAGSDLVEFTIPLDYKRTDKPVFIMLTASASKGGDYFAGGDGSNMWLDDIEIVYE